MYIPSVVESWMREAWLGHFASQDFDICLRSFCADSSSPQSSTIVAGNFTMENCSLLKSPQFFSKLPQQLRRQISKSWLAKIP